MKLKGFFLISFLLIALAGCGSKAPMNSAITLNLDAAKPDFSKFQVTELTGEGDCAGNEADPCLAEAKFKVTETIAANPMQLIEMDKPVKEIRGYNKQMKFEPGNTYTLKYEVIKINPTDVISWKFAGQE